MARYVGSKWIKTKALLKHDHLARYIPATSIMTKSSLLQQLNQYGMVYVKPVHGTYGNGVMRVEQAAAGYRYQLGKEMREFHEFPALYKSLHRQTGGKRYLVQRGIQLLEHNGRKFDIRVMVQYSPSGAWETTGIIGRVAAKDKIVTNVHSGGRIVPVERLLRSYTNEVNASLRSLAKLGVSAGKAMKRAFPGVYVIGLDIALDKSLHPWILEVNTNPDPYIFKKLPDSRVFKKIMSYAKAYPQK